MLKNCDDHISEDFCYFGNVCGFLSSIIWFFVLLPQIVHNYQRKSVVGISNSWAAMNFFASLINTIFIFVIANMPVFSKISAVYMPILNFIILLQIFYYHESAKKVKICYFFLLCATIIVLCGVLIFMALKIDESLSYIEWTSIFLWSFESYPQIFLNFSLSNTSALSKFSQFITFIGKSSDIVSNYLLIIPYQYRFLGFFSTTNAYFCIIQVLYYFHRDFNHEDNESLPLQKYKKEEKKKVVFVLFLGMCTIVLGCCAGVAFGFFFRVGDIRINVPILIGEYGCFGAMYVYTNWKKDTTKQGQFVPISEQ